MPNNELRPHEYLPDTEDNRWEPSSLPLSRIAQMTPTPVTMRTRKGERQGVRWEPKPGRPTAHWAGRGVLAQFLELADPRLEPLPGAPPRQEKIARIVRRLQRQWGPLMLCEHGEMGGFHGDDDDETNFRECLSLIEELDTAWVYHAHRLAAMLRTARALRGGSTGDEHDWRLIGDSGMGQARRLPETVSEGWQFLAFYVQQFLRRSMALVQVHVIADQRGTATGLGVVAGIPQLPALLAIELAFAIMQGGPPESGVAGICTYCLKPVTNRKRRPRNGAPLAHPECNDRRRWGRRQRSRRALAEPDDKTDDKTGGTGQNMAT